MHSSRSYYPPDPYAVQHQQTPSQYPPYASSQHNHPTYYSDPNGPPPPAVHQYPPTQQTSNYYDQSYPPSSSQYHQHQEPMYGTTTSQVPASNYYGTSGTQQTEVSQYAGSQAQASSAEMGRPQIPGLKSKPSPFGATGPYGIDAANSSVDYYRRLYYPYDPITGEYMKDATPPGGGDPNSAFPGPEGGTSANRPYTSGYSGTMMDGANGWSTGIGNPGASGSGQVMMMNAATASAGAGAGNSQLNPYMIPRYQENESPLLCCDVTIPGPSMTCMVIALFTMLVLVVIFTVVKFSIYIYPQGELSKSHEETLLLVDQITFILLICALVALVYMFGILFTSRRIRRQISSLLDCTSVPPNSSSSSYARRLMRAGYMPPANNLVAGYSTSAGAYQTTLVNDNMQYSSQYNTSSGRSARNYDSSYGNRSYPNYV